MLYFLENKLYRCILIRMLLQIQEGRIMKIDLHVHSSEISPCSFLSVEQLLELYSQTDYDGFVITNHFAAGACKYVQDRGLDFHKEFHETIRKAFMLGQKKGFLVLGGYEVRFAGSDNDYLVYGMTEEHCRDYEKIFAMTPREFGEFAAAEGFLFYQAHPFRNGMDIVAPECFFGIEIKNGHPRHDSRNDIAAAWAQKYDLHAIGGSDCHQVEDVGSSGIITDCKIENMDDLTAVLAQDAYSIV